HGLARSRVVASVQSETGVRGRSHRPGLHGEGGLRPAAGRSLLEADAAGLGRQGAAGVSQRPPERRPSGRAHRAVDAGGGASVRAEASTIRPMRAPQSAIFALGTASHAYLEFDAAAGAAAKDLVAAVASLREPRTTMGGVNLVAGYRPELWRAVVP